MYIIAKDMICITVLSSFRLHSPRHPTSCETLQSREWVILRAPKILRVHSMEAVVRILTVLITNSIAIGFSVFRSI